MHFSEVSKALNKTRGLYRRWLELQDDSSLNINKDELEWTSTELRNALRSIEWDLEDLEDTINILLLCLSERLVNLQSFDIESTSFPVLFSMWHHELQLVLLIEA